MHEIDYNELYGLESAEETGEKGPEIADPETDAKDQVEEAGEKGPEVAAPDVENEEEAAEGDAGEEAEGEEKPGQSKRERAAFAAARRDAEARARAEVAAAKAQTKAEVDAFVRSLGLKDANGKAIGTREEYEAYKNGRDTEQARAKLKRAGIEPEDIEALVAANPEVRAAKAVAAAAQAEKDKALEARQKAAFDEQIKLVGEIDPTVKSVEDLRSKPYFNEIYQMIQRPMSIVDAVRLATEDERLRRIAEGSAKSAAAKSASKAHLVPTASRGKGAAAVPAEIAAQYRVFFPGATDAEISKMYQKQLNQK